MQFNQPAKPATPAPTAPLRVPEKGRTQIFNPKSGTPPAPPKPFVKADRSPKGKGKPAKSATKPSGEEPKA